MQRAECCADAELNHLIKSSIKAPMNNCMLFVMKHTDVYQNSDIIQRRAAETRVFKSSDPPPTNPTTPWKPALFASYPLTMLRPAGLLCEPNPLASDPSSWEAH